MSDIDQSKTDLTDKATPEVKDTKALDFDALYKEHKDDIEKWFDNSGVGKKVMSAWKDAQVTQGINTFKEKHLPDLIQVETEKVRKEYEKKLNPEDKKYVEIESKLNAEITARKRAEIKATASESIAKLNLSLGDLTIDDFVMETQDATDEKINRFYKSQKDFEKKIREEEGKKFINANNYIPVAGNSEGVPFGGSHEKHAEAIRLKKTPASGPEFDRIDAAIETFLHPKK